MLISLIGTPWMPNISNGILVLEDINEHPFRVERMLLQLLEAGILDRQKGLFSVVLAVVLPMITMPVIPCKVCLIFCGHASLFHCLLG